MSTFRTITWEDMFYLVLVATWWRTTLRYGSNMYQYEECWFAAVSCMWIRSDMLCRWWIVNVIVNTVLSMVDRQLVITVLLFQRKTLVKVKLSTARIWFPARCQMIEHCTSMIFLLPAEQLHQDSLLLAEQDVIASAIAAGTFSSSIHHLSKLQPDRQRLIISSSVLMNSSTSQLQLKFCILCRDWQHYCVNSDILYGIMSTLFSRLGYCITLWLTIFLAD